MKVLIIIPAYNEEMNLKRVIGHLQQVCPQFDYMIVNDGSTDGTEQVCRQNQFRHISLPVNLGLDMKNSKLTQNIAIQRTLEDEEKNQ